MNNIYQHLPAQTQLTAQPQAGDTARQAELKGVAREFEQFYVEYMLNLMDPLGDPDENFGGGSAEDMLQPFHYERMAENMVSQGGIGLADGMYRELLTWQEQRQ